MIPMRAKGLPWELPWNVHVVQNSQTVHSRNLHGNKQKPPGSLVQLQNISPSEVNSEVMEFLL